MAGLCTGISYGLSQNSLNNNKEIIFVKLTDSAYRAIEEYQKNHAKLNSHPTIQFSGNEGLLSFPSVANNVGQHFSFSITDIEGPQGSFECLQQCQDQLDILGALTSKMRIHAKDDVYETTRNRMAEAKDLQEKKSTVVIKPNQTDIGRRIKLHNKNPLDRITNIPNLTNNRRDLSQNSSSIINNNLNSINNVNLNNNSSNSNQNNSISNALSNGGGSTIQSSNIHSSSNSGTSAAASSLGNVNGLRKSSSSGNGSLNGSSVNTGSSPGGLITANNHHTLPMTNGSSNMNGFSSKNGRGNGQTSGKTCVDVSKRPLKERVIHLLAIRPYKKPELFQRLTSEGLRDRERNIISTVLKSVSFLRDNTYHLHRHIWNDVQEDWQFYTEQEKQLLKRRKPQNLTPPLSSDGGSSTSGQSPTSTHNGSPPPPIKRPTQFAGEKALEGPTAKKPRISHVKKNSEPEPVISSRRGVTDSRETSNMNPRSRENEEIMVSSSNYFGSNVTPNAHESEDSGMSLTYSVLNPDPAKRIAPTINSSNDQDLMRLNANEYDVNEIQSDNEKLLNGSSTNDHDFDQFTRIMDIDQRRKYKTEFDNDYAEYRKLHTEIEQTSKRFEQLGKKLRSEKHNHQKYKDIQKQILKEYNQKMRDSHHQEAKRRFNYLHQKLSHIKRLVNEYDTALKNNIHIIQPNY